MPIKSIRPIRRHQRTNKSEREDTKQRQYEREEDKEIGRRELKTFTKCSELTEAAHNANVLDNFSTSTRVIILFMSPTAEGLGKQSQRTPLKH